MARTSSPLHMFRSRSESHEDWSMSGHNQGGKSALPSQLEIMEQVMNSSKTNLRGTKSSDTIRPQVHASSESRTPELPSHHSSKAMPACENEPDLFPRRLPSVFQSKSVYRVASTPPTMNRKSASPSSRTQPSVSTKPQMLASRSLSRRQQQQVMAKLQEQEEARQERLREIKAKVNYYQELELVKRQLLMLEMRKRELEQIQEEGIEEEEQSGEEDANAVKISETKANAKGTGKVRATKKPESGEMEKESEGSAATLGMKDRLVRRTLSAGRSTEASSEEDKANMARSSILRPLSPFRGLWQDAGLSLKPRSNRISIDSTRTQTQGKRAEDQVVRTTSPRSPPLQEQQEVDSKQQQEDEEQRGDAKSHLGSLSCQDSMTDTSKLTHSAETINDDSHFVAAGDEAGCARLRRGNSCVVNSRKDALPSSDPSSSTQTLLESRRSFNRRLTVRVPSEPPPSLLSSSRKSPENAGCEEELRAQYSLDSSSSRGSRHGRHQSLTLPLLSPSSPKALPGSHSSHGTSNTSKTRTQKVEAGESRADDPLTKLSTLWGSGKRSFKGLLSSGRLGTPRSELHASSAPVKEEIPACPRAQKASVKSKASKKPSRGSRRLRKAGSEKERESSRQKMCMSPRPASMFCEGDASTEVHRDYSLLFNQAREERRPRIIPYGALIDVLIEPQDPVKVFQLAKRDEEESNEAIPVPYKGKARSKKTTSTPMLDAPPKKAGSVNTKSLSKKPTAAGVPKERSSRSVVKTKKPRALSNCDSTLAAITASASGASARAASNQASNALSPLSTRYKSPIPHSEPLGLRRSEPSLVDDFLPVHRRAAVLSSLQHQTTISGPLRNCVAPNPDHKGAKSHKEPTSQHTSTRRSCFVGHQALSPREQIEGIHARDEHGFELSRIGCFGETLVLDRTESSGLNHSDTSDNITPTDSFGTSTP